MRVGVGENGVEIDNLYCCGVENGDKTRQDCASVHYKSSILENADVRNRYL